MGNFGYLKYLFCLFLPFCGVIFLSFGPYDSWIALIWTMPLWLIILLDWLSPKVNYKINKQQGPKWFYDMLLYLLTFLQLLNISLLLIYASQLSWGTAEEIITSCVNLLVMRILVGTLSGCSALIVAHELIHRSKYHFRLLGRLLLYSICYEHFAIAHIRGHHFNVATTSDIATAHLGESFPSYWKRVYIGHFKYAWHSEMERLGLAEKSILNFKILGHSVLQGLMIEVLLLVWVLTVFGWAALFIFLYQAFSAIRLLETINYYQHWGLENGQSKNTISWVNQSSVSEYVLIGLPHHISHHQNSTVEYYNTAYSDQGPVMPYGYFVTNLWVKLNNKSYCRISSEILKRYFQ